MADKYVTENRSGLWINDRKTDDWMDDFNGKIYVAKENLTTTCPFNNEGRDGS